MHQERVATRLQRVVGLVRAAMRQPQWKARRSTVPLLTPCLNSATGQLKLLEYWVTCTSDAACIPTVKHNS